VMSKGPTRIGAIAAFIGAIAALCGVISAAWAVWSGLYAGVEIQPLRPSARIAVVVAAGAGLIALVAFVADRRRRKSY
jgi:hypothetical protein